MVEGRTYTVETVDGEVLRGECLGTKRGFYLLLVNDTIVPLRFSTIAVMSEFK